MGEHLGELGVNAREDRKLPDRVRREKKVVSLERPPLLSLLLLVSFGEPIVEDHEGTSEGEENE